MISGVRLTLKEFSLQGISGAKVQGSFVQEMRAAWAAHGRWKTQVGRQQKPWPGGHRGLEPTGAKKRAGHGEKRAPDLGHLQHWLQAGHRLGVAGIMVVSLGCPCHHRTPSPVGDSGKERSHWYTDSHVL